MGQRTTYPMKYETRQDGGLFLVLSGEETAKTPPGMDCLFEVEFGDLVRGTVVDDGRVKTT